MTIGRGAATLVGGPQVRAAFRSIPAAWPGGRPLGEAYRSALADEEGDTDRIRSENPIASVIAEGVGATIPTLFAPGTAIARFAASRALTPRSVPAVGEALREAAALGGTYGYTEAEGGVGNRVIGGVIGGAAGATGAGILGAAAQPLSRPIVGAAGRAVVGGGIGAAADEEDRLRGAAIGATTLAAAPHAIRRLRGMNRVGAVGDDVAQVADPVAPEAAAPFSESALVRVLRGLRDDRPDLDLDNLAARAPEETAPVAIIEQGDNLRGLARAVRTVGGRGKTEIPEVLGERRRGQGDRIKGLFQRFTGIADRVAPEDALEDQARKRAVGGQQRYSETFAEFPDPIDEPDLARLVDDIEAGVPGGSVRQQVDEYVDYLIRRGKATPEDFFASSGDQRIPTLRYLDLIKQSAQRRVNFARRDPQLSRQFDERMEDEVKGAIGELRDRLVARTGGEEGRYGTALREWGGDTEVMERIQQGTDFLQTPEREVAKIKRESSSAAWDMYRQAALDKILDYADMIPGRADATKRQQIDLDVPAIQRKLRMLFDDETQWNAFRREMGKEVEMARSEAFIPGGSNTADKLMEVANLFDIPIEELVTPSGGLGETLRRAARWGVTRARAGFRSDMADETVDALLAGARGDTERYAALTRALRDLARKEQERSGRRRGVQRGVAATSGSRLGGD